MSGVCQQSWQGKLHFESTVKDLNRGMINVVGTVGLLSINKPTTSLIRGS